ncbi:phospholipase A1-like [Uranotaenia lowii]|uniref:phospholipase A1-like n=1 Tax=Uranotaenia lowii TaxID=190385 RepID=UPI00247A9001|nr:phospholipase A1-like [Uranotaenia lowii]
MKLYNNYVSPFLVLISILRCIRGDDAIIFPENDGRNELAEQLQLDLDDMEYERDNDGDSRVPPLFIPRDAEDDYVRLPDKNGDFEVVPRFFVRENRRSSQQFDAERYVVLRFYSRSNNLSQELSLTNVSQLTGDYGFKLERPTKILIHGWLGSSESEVIEPLAKALLDQDDFNVIAVDWEKGAQTLIYPVARYRVSKVAEVVAAMIEKLLEMGQTPDQFGIIGHSLGAHIAGLSGKRLKEKIAYIIGLDPASPLFRYKKHQDRLASTDAQYVEVIHSNGKALGLFRNIGTVDFYPNGGIVQPGCGWSLTCHHERAVHYFKESLKVKDYFANRCADVQNLGESCTMGKARLGGVELGRQRLKPSGVYYMLTAATSPFFRTEE